VHVACGLKTQARPVARSQFFRFSCISGAAPYLVIFTSAEFSPEFSLSNFRGCRFEKNVILFFCAGYLAYPLGYRSLKGPAAFAI
jgi:hypothetical protein